MDAQSWGRLQADLRDYAVGCFLADAGEPRAPLFVRRLLVSLLDCPTTRTSLNAASVSVTVEQLRLITRANLLDPRFGHLPLTFVQQMLLRRGYTVSSINVRGLTREEAFEVDQDVVCEQICAL